MQQLLRPTAFVPDSYLCIQSSQSGGVGLSLRRKLRNAGIRSEVVLVPQVVVDSPPRILLTPFERRFTVSKRPSFPDQMTTSGRPMKTLSLMKSLHGQLGNLQVTLALMGRYL